MTELELDYLKRALAALDSGECTLASEAKILQTVSEICAKNAALARERIQAAMDQQG